MRRCIPQQSLVESQGVRGNSPVTEPMCRSGIVAFIGYIVCVAIWICLGGASGICWTMLELSRRDGLGDVEAEKSSIGMQGCGENVRI
jgi:hypothetical protein